MGQDEIELRFLKNSWIDWEWQGCMLEVARVEGWDGGIEGGVVVSVALLDIKFMVG